MTRYEWLQQIALVKTDDCIPFPGSTNAKGYGHLRVRGSVEQAHRAIWEILNGDIPDGMSICHTCDNPSCINPAHLWMGTNTENHQDAVAKDRHMRKFSPQEKEEILTRYEQGASLTQISKEFGAAFSIISRIVRNGW